jgi:ATP-dependent Clp protease ATP-binding subunit ClpC
MDEQSPYSTEIADVLHGARKIAIDVGNSTIESEHILMAIIQLKAAGYAFISKQLSIPSLVIALRKIISQNSNTVAVEGNLLISKPVSEALLRLRKLSFSDSKDFLLEIYNQKGCTASAVLEQFEFSPSGAKSTQPKLKHHEVSSGGTPALDAFSVDLTKLASEGRLDPVVNRAKEINRIAEILGRRKKNNPVLIGEPGVGKSAIVEGLAIKIANGDVVESLLGKRIVSLNMASIVAGTKLRGQFEERMKVIIDELTKNHDIIVFIDEVHTLVGSGGPEGTGDASNILKPALSAGDIQCIGATTYDDYRKYIERDPALERRFQKITVEQPTAAETVNIIRQISSLYEKYHGAEYEPGIPELITNLADRFITDRQFPDKAIDILDEAGSVAKLNKLTTVTEETIRKVVSTMTGIPITSLGQSERDRLKVLYHDLTQGVIGQEIAIATLVKAVKRARTGIRNEKKPFTALLLGPTGVGKTETAKQLALCLFASEDALIRVDMSELAEPHSISKLIGSPPGYVGYDEGGHLTERVKKKPYSIILLDEVEKAHPEVFNVFLQVFDDGMLTDGRGKMINFKNTIILMTSNIGTSEAAKASPGFGNTDSKREKDDKRTLALKAHFRPEFLNRIDEIVHYDDLTPDAIKAIFKLYLKEIHGVTLELSEEAMQYFAVHGYSKEFGARPLRRLVQDQIESPIADHLINDPDVLGFYIDVQDDKIVVNPKQELKEQENL